MGPTRALLPCGKRLHLQHGPIDLIIGADGDRDRAFHAAARRFATILEELVGELSDLRMPLTSATARPIGSVARVMDAAVRPFARDHFVTRMAAVAGSVAETVLAAMVDNAALNRAFVNNGGDIAVHLAEGHRYTTAMADHVGRSLGQITIQSHQRIRGIASSGRHGRSHSLGIADSVTVLAMTAAQADVAATLIANAVDLPGHPAITRSPAHVLDENSDLGALPVVTGCAALSPSDCEAALAKGKSCAQDMIDRELIAGAALFLQDAQATVNADQISLTQRTLAHA